MTRNNQEIEIHETLPALPLRDIVIFPYTIYPLLIGRQFTINALQEAMLQDRQVFLCSQKRADTEKPEPGDLYHFGVVARVLQVMKLPNGALKALVEGLTRAKGLSFEKSSHYFSVKVEPLVSHVEKSRELEALSRTVIGGFSEYVRLNRRVPDEAISSISAEADYDHQADTVAAQLLAPLEFKQGLLETVDIADRLRSLATKLNSEIEILKLEKKIDTSVRDSLSQSQREHYLQQQLKAIREELGQYDDQGADIDEYYEKLEELKAPREVKERADEEIRKLSRMHPYSAESAVARGYLDWIFGLPWRIETEDRTDFREVEALLDADHHGLEKPKQRILEHLAVMKISKHARGPILCFVGPPGVGKTSLGKSIAHALGRKFVRVSLGGIHDEAEIRGHRRTYIGSLPGRIIQGLKKAGSRNPVFLLDEIDKVGSDFRGDPGAALLEALDPEQNTTFSDNFLELDFDLSKTLFITTANSISGIPHALLDRMEIIGLTGYTDYEKLQIARGFLIPKLKREMGLEDVEISIPDDTLNRLIRLYTRESGVREAERKLAALLRQTATKLARRKSKTSPKPFVFKTTDLKRFLGPERHSGAEVKSSPPAGYALGLAWTRLGGEILPIEVTVMPGKGKLTLTGKLGDVMKESANAGLSYIRSHSADYSLKPNFLNAIDVHVHVPEGAVPKDGPSAGIPITVAMISAFTGIPTKGLVGMTGEITLTGDILPIGGLNEKLLAAKRAGAHTVILPDKNRKDLSELKPEATSDLKLKFVGSLDLAIRHAFGSKIKLRRRKSGTVTLGESQPRVN